MSAVMDGVLRDEAKYLEMVEEKKTFVGVLEKELNEQKRKLNRAYKQVTNLKSPLFFVKKVDNLKKYYLLLES